MPTQTAVFSLISAIFVPLALAGCAAEGADASDDLPEMEASDLTSKSLRLGTGTTTFTVKQVAAQDLTLTVDCRPPANPDDVGPTFKLVASTLGVSAAEPTRAGYWSRTGNVAAGSHVLTFTNAGAPATCSIRSSAVPATATCRSSTSFRSPNTNHTHFSVGSDTSSDWEAFPASGNHWGAWAPWGKAYPKAIKRGFLLHNLEHGGVVFSYRCSTANESPACADAQKQLVAIAQEIGPRVIITPDPTQPEMFAVRGWRYGYSSSCLDVASAKQFAKSHYRQGREDADADPPIPFDPSTTNVPCNDLMAAPDSCGH